MGGMISAIEGDPTTVPATSQAIKGACSAPKYQGMTLLDGSNAMVYVEQFPNPRAGAPISNEVAHVPELDEYIASSGPFSNPQFFDAAQQLMSVEMTNSLRDWHLDSWPVSNCSFISVNNTNVRLV
jgi:hypothetical protein